MTPTGKESTRRSMARIVYALRQLRWTLGGYRSLHRQRTIQPSATDALFIPAPPLAAFFLATSVYPQPVRKRWLHAASEGRSGPYWGEVPGSAWHFTGCRKAALLTYYECEGGAYPSVAGLALS